MVRMPIITAVAAAARVQSLPWEFPHAVSAAKKKRMAIIKKKKSTKNKCWRVCREKRRLLHYWYKCKLVQPLWKTVWRFLKKLNIGVPVVAQQVMRQTRIQAAAGLIPGLVHRVKDVALP